jgi:hypothetical protein
VDAACACAFASPNTSGARCCRRHPSGCAGEAMKGTRSISLFGAATQATLYERDLRMPFCLSHSSHNSLPCR